MKLLAYHNAFLDNTVNLNANRLGLLETRVASIVRYLAEDDDVIGPLFVDHNPQGSWPHRTIIKPLPSDEFDADFLLLIEEVEEWSANPKEYLRQLREAFKRSSTYKSMIRKKNRCVRVGYAGDCHIDVVPHLRLANGRQVIINWAENTFEDTNPEGFTAWMKTKDDAAGGNLRKVIRLWKYLRDYKNTFSIPSVILTTLLGEAVNEWDTTNRYVDLPTALVNLATDLDGRLLLWGDTMLTITDPSCPGTSFNHRWDQDRYRNFKAKLHYYAEKMVAALAEPDKARSLTLWQEVFGPDFKQPADTAAVVTQAAAALTIPVDPGEQRIEALFPVQRRGYADITCAVIGPGQMKEGHLRVMRTVRKGRVLSFSVARCDIPEPYELYWKIKNRGSEATANNDLRGEIVRDDGARTHRETTRYAESTTSSATS